MSGERYIVNFIHDIAYIENETVAINASGERFRIKGKMMVTALKEIIQHFQTPSTLDSAVATFSNKYSPDSVRKILDFLIQKTTLIKESEAKSILKHDATYIEKAYSYTLGGKSLSEIHQLMAPLRICIIGTSSMVSNSLRSLSSGGLLTSFKIVVTDGEFEEPHFPDDVKIDSIHKGLDFSHIQALIKESDFIIAGANYYNHYLFNQINKICLKQNKSWIRIVLDGFKAEIGPMFIPDETCCYACLHTRSRALMGTEEFALDDLYVELVPDNNAKERAVKFAALYPLNAISVNIATSELVKHLVGLKCNLHNQVLELDCIDYQLQKSYIFKDYRCSSCVGGYVNE